MPSESGWFEKRNGSDAIAAKKRPLPRPSKNMCDCESSKISCTHLLGLREIRNESLRVGAEFIDGFCGGNVKRAVIRISPG